MKIAIVGNGFILGQTQSGNEIDASDLIVRVNPRKINKQITGEKTSIAVYAYDQVDKSLNFDNCEKWLFVGEPLSFNKEQEYKKQFGYNFQIFGVDMFIEQNMRKAAKARPTDAMSPGTGARVMYEVYNKFPYAEIVLYGFDWYKGEYHYWHTPENATLSQTQMHNRKYEEIIMRWFCREHPNVRVEETVRNPEFTVEQVPIEEPNVEPKAKEDVNLTQEIIEENEEVISVKPQKVMRPKLSPISGETKTKE